MNAVKWTCPLCGMRLEMTDDNNSLATFNVTYRAKYHMRGTHKRNDIVIKVG